MPSNNPYFLPYTINRKKNPWKRWLGASVVVVALAILVYNVPWVNERLSWRLDALKTNINYFFHPPQEAIFVPEENQIAIASASAAALTPDPTSSPAAASATSSPTEVPIPASTQLTGFKYNDQKGGWNLCGPSTLAMALTFWGWAGTKYDVANYVKPGLDDPKLNWSDRGKPDKNVMPYELEDFVDTQVPGMQAVERVGGDLERIKRFIAAGYPVIVEKGSFCNPGPTWCGHYLYVTGYDDAKQEFTIQDVYLETGPDGTGKNLTESYDDFLAQWRAFDYLFFVIYPENSLNEVIQLLGPWNDEKWANLHALEIAQTETKTLIGDDLFYAWFNVGTSHVRLFEYVDAAFAYDKAFQLYADLPQDENQPFRMMWYQTGPYFAYYYSGRYNDVINLADTTLNAMQEATLEESLYWRARASWALVGPTDTAAGDLLESVRINPHFCPGWQEILNLGILAPTSPWEGCSA